MLRHLKFQLVQHSLGLGLCTAFNVHVIVHSQSVTSKFLAMLTVETRH